MAWQLTEQGVAIQGDLTQETVAEHWQQRKLLFRQSQCTVDLAGLGRCDSSGVALLLTLMAQAKRQHCELRLQNIPTKVLSIARVSGCDALLATGASV